MKKIQEKEEETFNFKKSLLRFWDNVMEMHTEEEYDYSEIKKLENTRKELLIGFGKIEREFKNEYEELQTFKNNLIEKQDEYTNEYIKKKTDLKEKR